jgi:hypothetical protein
VGMTAIHQQTVECAIRRDTGQTLLASDLLLMPEQEFTALRRLATESRVKNESDDQTFLRCPVCQTPLWLTRRSHRSETGNRFFKHAREAQCPWYKPSDYTAEQILALRFHGQREGRLHKHLKRVMIDALSADPEVSDVVTEVTNWGAVLKGEWKRPDVRCRWRGKTVVFELQLSYTFISEVVKRDLFYRAENIFVIWVFRVADEKFAFVKDEKYFNKRNLFLLDDAAEAESVSAGRLMLTCQHSVPVFNEWSARTEPIAKTQLVQMADLTYPEDTYRPFFYDYEAALQPGAPRSTTNESVTAVELEEFKKSLQAYGEAVRAGHAEPDLLEAACKLSDERLRALAIRAVKYPYREALLRLLSITKEKPLITKYDTVYEVINAATQPGAATQDEFGFLRLYLEACDIFHPPMKSRQEERLALRRRMARSLERSYETDREVLELAVAMFPQLARVRAELKSGPSASYSSSRRWLAPNPNDKPRRGEALGLYSTTHAGVDWRAVLIDAEAARRSEQTVLAALEEIAARNGARTGDVENFLRRCCLIVSTNG